MKREASVSRIRPLDNMAISPLTFSPESVSVLTSYARRIIRWNVNGYNNTTNVSRLPYQNHPFDFERLRGSSALVLKLNPLEPIGTLN